MFVNWTVVCLLWDRCVCVCVCVNWSVVCLLWDRYVCELNCGVLAVGQMCF